MGSWVNVGAHNGREWKRNTWREYRIVSWFVFRLIIMRSDLRNTQQHTHWNSVTTIVTLIRWSGSRFVLDIIAFILIKSGGRRFVTTRGFYAGDLPRSRAFPRTKLIVFIYISAHHSFISLSTLPHLTNLETKSILSILDQNNLAPTVGQVVLQTFVFFWKNSSFIHL